MSQASDIADPQVVTVMNELKRYYETRVTKMADEKTSITDTIPMWADI